MVDICEKDKAHSCSLRETPGLHPHSGMLSPTFQCFIIFALSKYQLSYVLKQIHFFLFK